MQKIYNPKTIESAWYDHWEKQGYFKPRGFGEAFCIQLPPPNVTGQLHMGHGFQQTLMDILIRYHRMQGFNVLWQGGTDHAGIATQMVVERNLLIENISRHDLGREKFIEKIWEWKKTSGGQITKQMRCLGLSVDWSSERFTMDEGLSEAVQAAFIQLYEKGLIYRGKRLVNWDPTLLTAVSDLEVEHSEEEGRLYHIRYLSVEDPKQHLVIATTRPETLLADVAVAVNPNDARYQKFIGKQLHVPLTHRTVPIIADECVDADFGTGAVKITPAHDFNDYTMAQRHSLPFISIFTAKAILNENAPAPYQGLDRFVARKKIIEDLKKENLFVNDEKHILKIPRGDRSGDVLEPYLTDQWFIKIEALGKPALASVKKNKIQFIPKHWENEYFHWMQHLQDWCISRQLWWGHRIPAWYDDQNKIYVGKNEEEIRKKYKIEKNKKLNQDSDVLDTWFSSALWPFSTLGWPEHTARLKTFYPSQVLVTGFDIIFFWVARMIMFGLKFINTIPFHHVYITGLIRDAEGQKMSKTKGNVLDPLDIVYGITLSELIKKRTQHLMQPAMAKHIEETTRHHYPKGIPAFGTDALRFTFCALASTARDINFDLARVEGYRHFCNKLWNAARFVFLNIENTKPLAPKEYHFIDRYILSQLQSTIKSCHQHLKNYRFDLLANTLYDFVWNEYCDWYLELSKPILNDNTNPQAQNATRYTLLYVLDTILRLLHPIIPFITEEIWQKTKNYFSYTTESIMVSAYPTVNDEESDESLVADIQWLKTLIVALRTLRSQNNIPPGKPLTAYLVDCKKEDIEKCQQFEFFILTLARLQKIVIQKTEEVLPSCVRGLANGFKILLPVSDFLNKEQELQRLTKEIEKIEKELKERQVKLDNPTYLAKAPREIVEKEKARVKTLEDNLLKLKTQG
ncbi:MAG: valine--tRNA ligase [Gammaproteobacteria bacterium RIFCSPHIGHO2_12_38_15]|nr:MAG: valine--tRNA ligase [Gammaproteobacteria bacterium RIFCSPHIGHO2_12_38_15]